MFYVIGDIHGCYDEFIQMLDMIKFTPGFDKLFFVGDYIDRGPKSYEMLSWLEENQSYDCFKFIRGNHEQEFIAYVDLLNSVDSSLSKKDIFKQLSDRSEYYDLYGTIGKLIEDGYTGKLTQWADMFRKMPTSLLFHYDRQDYVVTHAGYKTGLQGEEKEEFNLYAREKAYTEGGRKRTVVIAGHTPTIVKGEMTYNKGNVFIYQNDDINCTYYNIDCGCCFKSQVPNAKLACLRLDDKEIFYI